MLLSFFILMLHSPFKLAPVPPLFFDYFLTFWHKKMFWAYLVLPLIQPWNISHFFREGSALKFSCDFQMR